MRCFGDKSRNLHCKIILLDQQELVRDVHANVTGQDLLTVVFQHLNLIETAYFGLRFIDNKRQSQWLDPNKKVVRQLKGGGPHTLYFAVKFYAADPCKLLEEITRYQFFLQVKQDVLHGRLPVPQDTAAQLAALALQSELGDFEPQRHKGSYVNEFRFVAHQTADLEAKISEIHKTLRGVVPAAAELRYLDKVKWMDLYGVDLHPVLGEDTVEYFLGLTPSGIIVLRNKNKVGNYFWPRISKVSFKGRYFMLRVKDKNNDECTYGFETPSKDACKSLYKCSSQHLAFFRLVQMSGPPVSRLFAGRNSSETKPRSPPKFRRFPSQRLQRVIDGAATVLNDESNSDSDKTIDAKSTTQLAPYNQKTVESPLSQRSSGSRRNRSRSRNRSHSVESQDSTDSRAHRRHRRRSRSRHASDNESEVSGMSNVSQGSRRRRRHKSRDSSASESESQSSRSHRSHRNRRRGSSYELVDSESQWREIQLRQQQQQQQQQQHYLPTASSTPVHPVQQAAVRKAADSFSQNNTNSLMESLQSDSSRVNGDTESEASSHRHRHKKHHHSHHKSRSQLSQNKSPSKRQLPAEIMPHLHFGLLEPPANVTVDQLREIPYEVVGSSAEQKTVPRPVTNNENLDINSLKRKILNARPQVPTESRIVSVDNDSPPPPYSPPQNAVESLMETTRKLELNNDKQLNENKKENTAAPPIPPRSTPSPQVGIGPSRSSYYSPQQPFVQSPSYPTTQQRPLNSVGIPANHMTPNATSANHITPNRTPSNYINSNGHLTNQITSSGVLSSQMTPNRIPANHMHQTVSTPNPMNGFTPSRYSTNGYPAPNPHAVGLPVANYPPSWSNVPTYPTRPVTASATPQESPGNYSPMTLPRINVSSASLTPVSVPDKTKSSLPVSPLATGVTVTNTDSLTRNKYVTRPKTPLTPKSAATTNVAGTYFSFDFPAPDTTQPRAWHSSLPRPTETRRAPRDATLPRQKPQPTTTSNEQARRSSSLELILSPMIQSTSRPSKNVM